jgi:hypothetical protein
MNKTRGRRKMFISRANTQVLSTLLSLFFEVKVPESEPKRLELRRNLFGVSGRELETKHGPQPWMGVNKNRNFPLY